MKRFFVPAVVLVIGVASLGFYGCGSRGTEPQTTNTPATDDHADHGDHTGNEDATAMDKMKAELAKLSPEDAAAAEKQHMCPVSGEMLGVMGAPKKVDVNGQSVWICCDGCQDRLLANPDEYLAKLNKE